MQTNPLDHFVESCLILSNGDDRYELYERDRVLQIINSIVELSRLSLEEVINYLTDAYKFTHIIISNPWQGWSGIGLLNNTSGQTIDPENRAEIEGLLALERLIVLYWFYKTSSDSPKV